MSFEYGSPPTPWWANSETNNPNGQAPSFLDQEDISENIICQRDSPELSPNFIQSLLASDGLERRNRLAQAISALEFYFEKSSEDPIFEKLLRSHFLTISRLSKECPFPDIKEAFQNLLKKITHDRPNLSFSHINPSRFLNIPSDFENEKSARLFQEICLRTGMTNLIRVMSLHPSYLDRFYRTFHLLMYEDGKIPLHWRNYIAILSVSQFRCDYLVQQQEQEFLINKGYPKWLQGIEHTPQKILNLLPFINLISHRPWLLNKAHIATLVKGADAWSIGELMHAMLIIVTFTSLAGFVHGCGIIPEINLSPSPVTTIHDEDDSTSKRVENENIMEVLKSLPEQIQETERGFEEKVQDFERAANEESRDYEEAAPSTDLQRYIGSSSLTSQEFDVHSLKYSIFRFQDYDWKEDGYSLFNLFFPDAASYLDTEFNHIQEMTYKRFYSISGVNTGPLRNAVWFYVHRLKGVFHDDYPYEQIGMCLTRELKHYIHKVVKIPYKVTAQHFQQLRVDLTDEEKCHIVLIAVEASKQADLLYGCRAVMQHMT
eukprot:TRINITY_DN2843_c0_g1_i1.p1 TRINITY_DN2843_c0_g1~~TRINITY_DN2843_c0_g1_i1.p1  ORF type:complete len:545 (-),score=95.04 TRINITY_DN2843_c0_g1_i1:32-1666(-)